MTETEAGSEINPPVIANITWSADGSGPLLSIGSCPPDGKWGAPLSSVSIKNVLGNEIPPTVDTTYGPYEMPSSDGFWLPSSQIEVSVSNAPIGPPIKAHQQGAKIYIDPQGHAFGFAYVLDFMPANPRSGHMGQFGHMGFLCGGYGCSYSMHDFIQTLSGLNVSPTVTTTPVEIQFDSPAASFGISIG